MIKQMYIYIMGNDRPTLYAGVTSDLIFRVTEHKEEKHEGFTKRYHLHKLLYFEAIEGQYQAIGREKQIKDMDREEKLEMIKKMNPELIDLFPMVLEQGLDSGLFITSEKADR